MFKSLRIIAGCQGRSQDFIEILNLWLEKSGFDLLQGRTFELPTQGERYKGQGYRRPPLHERPIYVQLEVTNQRLKADLLKEEIKSPVESKWALLSARIKTFRHSSGSLVSLICFVFLSTERSTVDAICCKLMLDMKCT